MGIVVSFIRNSWGPTLWNSFHVYAELILLFHVQPQFFSDYRALLYWAYKRSAMALWYFSLSVAENLKRGYFEINISALCYEEAHHWHIKQIPRQKWSFKAMYMPVKRVFVICMAKFKLKTYLFSEQNSGICLKNHWL